MKHFKQLRTFRTDEEGAVTVDWVVLTAAVIGLGVAALGAIKGGVGSISSLINGYLSSQTISSTF